VLNLTALPRREHDVRLTGCRSFTSEALRAVLFEKSFPLESFELDAMRFDRSLAETALLVFLVVGEVALEPFDAAVAFEGKDVRGNPV
jgi:hypothetical protein